MLLFYKRGLTINTTKSAQPQLLLHTQADFKSLQPQADFNHL